MLHKFANYPVNCDAVLDALNSFQILERGEPGYLWLIEEVCKKAHLDPEFDLTIFHHRGDGYLLNAWLPHDGFMQGD